MAITVFGVPDQYPMHVIVPSIVITTSRPGATLLNEVTAAFETLYDQARPLPSHRTA